MKLMVKTVQDKINTVIEKNTFYFFNKHFEETYEGNINSIKESLLFLKNEIDTKGLNKDIFYKLLSEKPNGLKSLLALTGFSNESLKRLITLIRVVDDDQLNNLSLNKKWNKSKKSGELAEWSDAIIEKMILSNEYFRQGIINIFFEGATIPFLIDTIPLFELKKLSISKLKFDLPSMIDTLVRYKEKGSYSGQTENNPETVISDLLQEMNVAFEKGDLSELIKRESTTKRTMDFIIPDKRNPIILIECSFLVTTSSGQGDKSKTEISVKKLIERYYPKATFIGFVDGIGWYVRKQDLSRMVKAYDDVFTFHSDELLRFKNLLKTKYIK